MRPQGGKGDSRGAYSILEEFWWQEIVLLAGLVTMATPNRDWWTALGGAPGASWRLGFSCAADARLTRLTDSLSQPELQELRDLLEGITRSGVPHPAPLVSPGLHRIKSEAFVLLLRSHEVSNVIHVVRVSRRKK